MMPTTSAALVRIGSERRKLALLFIGLALLPASCSLIERSHHRRMLPAKIGTGWFYAEGSCAPNRSAFAFNIDSKTLAALEQEGLDFFKGTHRGTDAARYRYFRGDWQRTPLPRNFFNAGTPGSLLCGELHSWWWPSGIPEALQQPGGYFQNSGGGRSIYVLPTLGLVIGDTG